MFQRSHDLHSPWLVLQAWIDAAQEWSDSTGCTCLMLEAMAATAPDILDDRMLLHFLPWQQLSRRRLRFRVRTAALVAVRARSKQCDCFPGNPMPVERELKSLWFNWHQRHSRGVPLQRSNGYVVVIDFFRELCGLPEVEALWARTGLSLIVPKSAVPRRIAAPIPTRLELGEILPEKGPWHSHDPWLRAWARDAAALARGAGELVNGRHFAQALGISAWIAVFIHRHLRNEGRSGYQFLDARPNYASNDAGCCRRAPTRELERTFRFTIEVFESNLQHISLARTSVMGEWALMSAFIERPDCDFIKECSRASMPIHIIREVISDLSPAKLARDIASEARDVVDWNPDEFWFKLRQ